MLPSIAVDARSASLRHVVGEGEDCFDGVTSEPHSTFSSPRVLTSSRQGGRVAYNALKFTGRNRSRQRMSGISATPGWRSRAEPWRRRPTGSQAADPFSIASSAASIRCPEPPGGGGDVSSRAESGSARHRLSHSAQVSPSPVPIEFVVPSQVNETAVVDRHTHSRG